MRVMRELGIDALMVVIGVAFIWVPFLFFYLAGMVRSWWVTPSHSPSTDYADA